MPHRERPSRSDNPDTLPTPSSDPPDHPEKPNDACTLPAPARFLSSLLDSQPKPCPASQPHPLSRPDQGSTANLSFSHTFHPILPAAGPPSEHLPHPSSGEVAIAKRRPLPTPPPIQNSPSSSDVHRLSDFIPSSPPPPYSMFLPTEDPVPMSRDLSRAATSPSHTILAPEAPVIMAPLPNEQGAPGRAPYDSFLCHSPSANTWIAVETYQYEYVLLVRLPGFKRDGITIATKRRRILHVVADSWEPEGGHFERRVSFGYDAELAQVRAEFDGEMLRIVVPRHISFISS